MPTGFPFLEGRIRQGEITMPLITITQNFGSNGLAIARKVAEGLGWELFDDQKLKELVQQKGISAKEISQLDEKTPGYWDIFFKSRPQIFLNVLESVVYEVAHRGIGVIIGHGSQLLLKDFDCAFHVRILTGEGRRADRLAAEQGISREAALRLIRLRDREQAGFFRFAFQLDMDDLGLYDLIINTHKLEAETAAGLVIRAATSDDMRACSLNALEAMERLALEKKVRAALLENRIDDRAVIVEVSENGVASVAGVSPNFEEKNRIEAVVGRVPGVSKVVSAMEVIRGAV
jgi:cytidylate kinase